MKRNHFLTLATVAMLTLCLTDCKPKDEEIPYEGITMTNGYVIDVETQEHDLTADYPIHFSITLSNDSLIVQGLTSKPSQDHGLGSRDCPSKVLIADYGKVNALSKIKDHSPKGSYSTDTLAVEKHGYIIKAWGDARLNEYHSEDLHDPDTLYTRLWLEEATDNGFKARYEVNYKVEE